VPRSCTVCEHPKREEIDKALVAGDANTKLSSVFAVSEQALRRHKGSHLPAKLVMAEAAAEVAEADSLLGQVRALQRRVLDILDKAEEAGELRTALSAIREARGNLELLAKLLGELDERPVTNVLVSAEWVTLRTAMMEALGPYPRARVAVAACLSELEGQ
jgi:hypothetical protein